MDVFLEVNQAKGDDLEFVFQDDGTHVVRMDRMEVINELVKLFLCLWFEFEVECVGIAHLIGVLECLLG